MLVEVCSNSLESAMNAEKAGADRIELCSELAVGGVTPSYGLLKSVKKHISIPVNVLIRPRGGDFTYSDLEFQIMLQNIALCVDLGFNGIVTGVLHDDFSLDVERTAVLIKAAGDLNFTFHRAFDWVKEPKKTLKELEGLGVDTILTSGQQNKAVLGADLLVKLQEETSSITIMPGSGVNANNVQVFKDAKFRAVHLSGVAWRKTLGEPPLVSMNSPSFLSDEAVAVSDVERVSAVVDAVK